MVPQEKRYKLEGKSIKWGRYGKLTTPRLGREAETLWNGEEMERMSQEVRNQYLSSH